LIRIFADAAGATLNVAGDLIGEWAGFLERECLRQLERERELSLDLSDVKRLDEAGIGALRRLKERGVRITRCSRLFSELIGGCEASSLHARAGSSTPC
jgi:ABC-type transporter Mla MlaB component